MHWAFFGSWYLCVCVCTFHLYVGFYFISVKMNFSTLLHILPGSLFPSKFQKSHLPQSNPQTNTHTLKILISLRSKGCLCNPSRPSSASYQLCFQRVLYSKPCCSQNISETLHGRLCIMNSPTNMALKYILMHEF